ncbi:helix-turn-helix domain-containing protein [Virgibacillus halophilus]|uniref:AraC family transcriptional regulator n=1 Tax=Tigheibacillus halophilus TaxID=361280 RepID=A0ABU5C5T8_9BACI|nr:AraC family transcriptional regulator [Virgibacillus halophilus]
MQLNFEKNIGFRFLDNQYKELPAIYNIGWERRIPEDKYNHDCRLRKEPQLIFQYTVSGEGRLEVHGKVHKLKPGQGFLIMAPGPYRYWQEPSQKFWEFKFITLSLGLTSLWSSIIKQNGHIINFGNFKNQNDVLTYWEYIYGLACSDAIKNVYTSSSLAYCFLMELQRWVDRAPEERALSRPIRDCMTFIQKNFHKSIGLREMTLASGVSKYHLIRLFKENLGESPVQYLIKLRIKKAVQLIIDTSDSMENIAIQCGFSSGNYFAKVFKKWMKVSPSDFRQDALVDRIGYMYIT